MKIIPSLAAAAIMSTALSVTAFASQSSVSSDKSSVSLAKEQTEFQAVISVTPDSDYAGVEIAVKCPDNVTLKSSDGSSGSMSASPTLANSCYWTSFFESDNVLSGTLDMTLNFSCTEDFDVGEVVLDQVKVYTKNGAGVDTELLSPSLCINVSRTNGGSESVTSSEGSTPSKPDESSSDATDDPESSSADSSTSSSGISSSASDGSSSSASGNSGSGSGAASGKTGTSTSGSKKTDNTANPDTGSGILGITGAAVVLSIAALAVKKKTK